LLNQQIAALRRQIGSLQSALEASEERDQKSQTQIVNLGKRLNVALAQRVQELARYRSEFFGRLRKILGNRSDISIVGDRFVFQSEVLFAKAEANLNFAGQAELGKLADAIKQLEGLIPVEIKWVLRVDGHTDADPIALAPGDVYAVLSDGFFEAANDRDELFGTDRVNAIIKLSSKLSAQGILDAIRESVERFTGGAPIADDQTAIIIKRNA